MGFRAQVRLHCQGQSYRGWTNLSAHPRTILNHAGGFRSILWKVFRGGNRIGFAVDGAHTVPLSLTCLRHASKCGAHHVCTLHLKCRRELLCLEAMPGLLGSHARVACSCILHARRHGRAAAFLNAGPAHVRTSGQRGETMVAPDFRLIQSTRPDDNLHTTCAHAVPTLCPRYAHAVPATHLHCPHAVIRVCFVLAAAQVVALQRTRIGGLQLDSKLPRGEWRVATASDLEAVFSGPSISIAQVRNKAKPVFYLL